jgi:hypothetical protein
LENKGDLSFFAKQDEVVSCIHTYNGYLWVYTHLRNPESREWNPESREWNLESREWNPESRE